MFIHINVDRTLLNSLEGVGIRAFESLFVVGEFQAQAIVEPVAFNARGEVLPIGVLLSHTATE